MRFRILTKVLIYSGCQTSAILTDTTSITASSTSKLIANLGKVFTFTFSQVYKFVNSSCSASCIGQTCQYLTTRINKHFDKDKKSHIYQHLMSFQYCLDKYSKDCFSVLDTANAKHQLRIKESLYITLLKPILNKLKQYQYITSLSF